MNNSNRNNINGAISKNYIRKQKKRRVKRGGFSDDMSQQMMNKLGELKANVQSRMADAEMTGGADGPRHFRLVEVDGRKLNHGIGYIEIKGKQTPLNAAKKLLRSYCRSKGLKGRSKLGVNIKFHIQEVSRGSKHKVFGPYSGRYREYTAEEKKKAMAAGQKFTMKAVVKLMKSGHKKMDGGAKKKRRVVKKKTTKRRRSMRGGNADSAPEAKMHHAALGTDAGLVGGAKRRRRTLKKKRVVKRKRGGAKPMGMKTHSGGAKKRRTMKKKRVVKKKRGGKKSGQKNNKNNNNQNGGAKKRRTMKKKRTTKKRRSMRGGSM